MPRVTLVGEGMLELTPQDGSAFALSYGGDALNTAIHMARLGHDVAFASALGDDPFSHSLRAAWEAEGIDCSPILVDPSRSAGLYAISLSDEGERTFTYWRGDSAARQMFALPESDSIARRALAGDCLAFSLVTLAILPDAGRETLLALARDVRDAGGMVAFDGNYRPRLWSSGEEAAIWRDRAIAVASIGLPTLDDEVLIGGPHGADAVAARWEAEGCAEVVVKLGAEGCRLPGGELVAPERPLAPVDTSGAGDAFNAGYLAARLAGAEPLEAARRGNALAGWTIMRRGAIPRRDQDYP
ncbi:sugar kinase [Aurantiacibacter luteus]|uniref:2-dehydro-3-deoxygluconokinase n=1 Tax=Aurantiacibacter luteus TaxID=1581420 RepID=A0A0G9MPQ8_9SPHN|nr:sugar kinase [Aurantiacibacter luteus]KLE31283.1 2-dehydro-3-deoxygluconokinase [Aurantiacibacter luteus]